MNYLGKCCTGLHPAEEKEVAAQLQKIFGQTIFGITFYRSIVNGPWADIRVIGV